MPKVSVIVPNYNHARYLPKRIASILSQTYQDFELILMDDQSSDTSVDILKQYQHHPKVSHLLLNEHNSGNTFRQWNTGMHLAQGEYIWLAESDDYADPHFLEVLVTELEKNERIGLAYCQSYLIDENNSILFSLKDIYGSRFDKDFYNKGADEVLLSLSVMNTIANASAVVFRKKLIQFTHQSNYAQFRYCGDWMFWITILLHCDIYYHAKELNYFRRSPQAEANQHKNNLMFIEGYVVWRYIKEKLHPQPKTVHYVTNLKAQHLFGRIQSGYRSMSLKTGWALLRSAFQADKWVFFRLANPTWKYIKLKLQS